MTNPIYTSLSINTLKELIELVDNGENTDKKVIVIKFGAEWCGPCNRIKPYCHNVFKKSSNKVICFDINIDEEENIELYQAYKQKKMIKTIPAIFAYSQNKERNYQHWWIPDFSVNTSNIQELDIFFNRVNSLSR